MADNTGAAAAALAGGETTPAATTETTQTQGASAQGTGQGTTAAPEWVKDWEPEDAGYIEKKGYRDPKDLYKAYRSLERTLSNDKIVLPKDGADPAEWDAVWNKLGRPEAPDKYAMPEGADAEMFKSLAPGLHKAGLSNAQVGEITKAYNDYVGKLVQGQENSYLEDQSKAMASLEREWGKDGPKEIEFNRRAMRALGLSVEDATRYMQGGAEKFLRLLNLAGRSIAEDNAGDIRSDETLGFGLTPNRAAAELAELTRDKEFMARVARRDPVAKAKYDRLLKAYSEGGKARTTISKAFGT